MSRVKSKGTRIERIFSSALRKAKIKFKRYVPVIGKPDFVITEEKIAIFCDSAFWHGYKKMGTSRHAFKSNKRFWLKKISGNIERDRKVNRMLKKEGWKVLRFWDFQILKDIDKCIGRVKKVIAQKLSQ